MPRVKRGTKRRAKRKKILDRASGYFLTKSKLYRSAKEAVERGLKFSFSGRKQRKRQFRSLWIVRIRAASKLNGLSYNQFIHGLKKAGVELDRKILADLAVKDAPAFKSLVEQARAHSRSRFRFSAFRLILVIPSRSQPRNARRERARKSAFLLMLREQVDSSPLTRVRNDKAYSSCEKWRIRFPNRRIIRRRRWRTLRDGLRWRSNGKQAKRGRTRGGLKAFRDRWLARRVDYIPMHDAWVKAAPRNANESVDAGQ